MADSPERVRLVSEIAILRKQHLEFIDSATFFGWTPETKADYEECAERIELLVFQLAKLDLKD